MLQRKLLVVLGVLVALVVITAVGTIVLLSNLFNDWNRMSAGIIGVSTELTEAAISVRRVEVELDRLDTGLTQDRSSFEHAVGRLNRSIASLDEHAHIHQVAEAEYRQVCTAIDVLHQRIDDASAGVAVLADMKQRLVEMTDRVQRLAEREQRSFTNRFRWTVLGIGAVFVILLNVSIVLPLRVLTTVMGPVRALAEASRHLANEEFDHRVDVTRDDELGELAEAFNHLAVQMQRNEERRLETLRQVATTLNHELNNAIAIIEIQVHEVSRHSPACVATDEALRNIHRTLARMGKTVSALLRVRRIVLTDYRTGVKMLDLDRSTEPGDLVEVDRGTALPHEIPQQ